MPLTRKEKELEVAELQKRLNDYSSVIIWRYHGIDSNKLSKLRSDIKEADGINKVYKNRLAKLAFEAENKSEINESLLGPNSFLFLDGENIQPLKILNEIVKENDKLEYVGGFINGVYQDAQSVAEIASLPSKIELVSMLLSVLQAPIRNLAYSLSLVSEAKPAEDTSANKEAKVDVEEKKTESVKTEVKTEETQEQKEVEETTVETNQENKEESTEENSADKGN